MMRVPLSVGHGAEASDFEGCEVSKVDDYEDDDYEDNVLAGKRRLSHSS